MDGRARLAVIGVLSVALTVVVPVALVLGVAFTLAACSDEGDLSVVNESDYEVTILTGDEEATVSASGGVVLLDYGCTPGDVTIELSSGSTVILPGPVCPDHEIVVDRDGAVRLRAVAAGGA
ncbi:hypothetical protein [Cellulomonas soli]|uniref:Uncharacterized protein n=1 Tax=Cellulomonas soli TaxID=931535 RepID=A0A512PE03_9CELL|nr:hypothetical protein [Cellulomonas soli]NYI59132.1 hypothetical protein [Cellulomonas soli]GEP69376.1 hypothetical protein CSO01_20910 [Cellulomonas soli]